MTTDRPVVCVLAVAPILEVTVEVTENAPEDPQLHVHPGGQGLWVARMANTLGARVVVCGPFGGETGAAAAALARREGLELRATAAAANGGHVMDYRGGERDEVVVMASPALDRHAQDDLFGAVLVASMTADVAVITGADTTLGVPPSFFGRVMADLRRTGRPTVVDLSGDQARAAVEAGGCVVKISDEEMVGTGFADDDTVAGLRVAAQGMVAEGAAAVVVSRAAEPALVVTPEGAHLLTAPPLTTVEHRGAGDSMTAALSVGVGRGLPLLEAARLAVAAGALNVTRRGLGTGRRAEIEELSGLVEVERA